MAAKKSAAAQFLGVSQRQLDNGIAIALKALFAGAIVYGINRAVQESGNSPRAQFLGDVADAAVGEVL